MTVDVNFRAALVARPALLALVGQRVYRNMAAQDAPAPMIVWSASHDHQGTLDGGAGVDVVTFNVECWGRTPVEANDVQAQARAALAAYVPPNGSTTVYVLSQQSGRDDEAGLDCEILSVEWIAQ